MIISFTSDFGLADGWVGVCHGVIAEIASEATVIDVAHDLEPYDLRQAAVVLAASVPHIPSVVDLAIVDPGVGTTRRRVVLRACGRLLVGPDNGIFAPLLARLGGAEQAFEISDERWFKVPGSPTFDGRDVFAPVAAHLASGLAPHEVGRELGIETLAGPPWSEPVLGDRSVQAEVAAVDRYGSIRLSIDDAQLAMPGAGTLRLHGPPPVEAPVGRTFGDVAPGELVWLVDSSGFWTLAAREADASAMLGLKAGEPVCVSW